MIDIPALLSTQGHLGWIPPSQRSQTQNDAHDAAVAKMHTFALAGDFRDLAVGEKFLLTDTWDHPMTVAGLGRAFIGWHQYSGSCVGEGGGTALQSLVLGDAILRGDQERIILAYWPLNYARSRLAYGERGPGEGSMGSTFAESCKADGVLDFSEQGLAPFHVSDAYTLGASDAKAKATEIQYSDGTQIGSDLLTRSRTHIVQSVAQARSFDQLWQGVLNKYPATFANSYLCPPGGAKVQGDALTGKLSEYGPHQQSIHGAWNHPKLGRMLRWQNTWGPTAMGDPDPTPQEKPGGYWVTEAEVNRLLAMQDTEAFILSQYNGYPSQPWNPSPW